LVVFGVAILEQLAPGVSDADFEGIEVIDAKPVGGHFEKHTPLTRNQINGGERWRSLWGLLPRHIDAQLLAEL